MVSQALVCHVLLTVGLFLVLLSSTREDTLLEIYYVLCI